MEGDKHDYQHIHLEGRQLRSIHTNNVESANIQALCRTGAYRMAIAMRSIPRPKIIGAVFAAAAVLLGFTAPAQAQATDIVYVSNADQKWERGANMGSVKAYGQQFTTGGRAGGYDLKRIEVGITTGGSGLVELMTDSAGLPGTTICPLTVVGGNADGTFNTGTGTVSFNTSLCDADQSHLAANTKYWVAFIAVFVMGVTDAVIDATKKTAEDPGAIAGWSIADRYHAIKNENDPWTWSGWEHALQISVVGTNTPPTASGGTVDTDEDIAYTFQAANLGFSDDDDDVLDHVTITELLATGTGTLSLGDTTISSTPATVTPDQLDGTLDDNLKYTPPANSAGPAFASFKFKVNDGIQDSAESTMTIDLLPVVSADSGLTAINYADNRTDAVDTYSASGSPTWSLTGTDSDQFNMTTGVLTFASSPDYENPTDDDGDNDYELTVVATITDDDDSSSFVTGELVVTVSVEEADRAALLALYNDTGGDDDNWRHDTKWNSSSPLGEWHGVTTNDAGRVTELNLDQNQLEGLIPAELGDLTNLVTLDFTRNNLTGAIPKELGNLTNLVTLNLAYNPLTGSIPKELGNLTNLETLALYESSLEGSIPAELGGLTNVTNLALISSGLEGSIPAELGDLAKLEVLRLHGNSLSGSIPADLGKLTKLTQLSLHTNSLEGSIPAELGNLTNLAYLYLGNNQLSGGIQTALGELTNLQELELNDNGLTGSIPAALGDLTNLTLLALNSNQLTGSIPAELGDLSNLKYLYLNSNSLSESIPTELGKLTKLEELYLHSNSLTGAIPLEFVNLVILEYLYVDDGLCVPADTAFQDWLGVVYDFQGNSSNFCADAPSNLSATQGDDSETTLSWDDPGDSAISGYQYRQKAGTGAYGSWTDIPESAPGGSNATGFTVTGLSHSTEYTFELRAVDASGPGLASSVTAKTAPNDAPTASHVTVSTDEDTAYTFAAAEFGFSDPNPNDKLAHVKITALPGTDQGTLSLDGTDITDVTTPKRVTKTELDGGKLEYTPPANANGTALATFDFKVNDGELDSAASYTITVDVKAVNDPPEAADDSATTKENTAVVVRVLENDSEVDEDGLTLTEVGTPSNGAAMITDDSTTITYTPNTGYVGSDSFSYTVSDGATPPLTATGMVNVTVTRNVDLSDLTISGGMLNPTFAVDTTSYTVGVANSVTSMTVTPTTADPTAKVTVNGTPVASGESFEIALPAGAEPTITVLVTAADGSVDKTYTIKILRDPSVAIATEAAVPVSGPFEVTITFSRAVTGFEQSDLEVTNGTVTDFTEVSSSEYRATIKPKQLGQPVVVVVPEDAAEDAAGNGNRAAEPFEVETKLGVSYEEESYTATEGGDPIAVTVKLSQGWAEQLAIPIQVRRPETTELDDYTVEGLAEWDAQEGSGTLSFAAGEVEQTYTITAEHDGDGDDETVELGFGELPEIVMAGEPSVATVTLEDKGLVELEVSFGQAAYEVKEGQGVDIELMVSPAADRRVEVPLVVALVGGTTPEDYSGVPALVVFEEGESEGTISVELLADEVNDPGEGIMLSLGELPEAVIAGDPSSTEVHFIQYRTAEQFSQSLEVMLAVMARSMGESAQTAIEGRFERYRQWSRMRTTGSTVAASSAATGAMTRGRAAASTYRGAGVGRGELLGIGLEGLDGFVGRSPGEPGVGDAAESRAQPETGSSGSYEGPQREPWRSWLPGLSLGSLGRVPGFGQTHMRASSGYGMAPRGGVHGQERFYGTEVAEGSPRGGSSEYSGTRAQGLNLSGVSVEMPLAEQEAGKGWVPVLWAQGDLQSFDGELRRIGMNYRGGLEAAHVGVDFYINVKMLAGLSYMRSWGDLDYTDDGVDGVLESRINSVHPYLYWQPKEGFSTWVIGGWGAGQVEVREPGRDHDFDADFRMLAGGTRAVLRRRGNSEWGLRADAFTAQLETAALEDLGKVRGEAHRARFMVEWVHDRALSEGRSLSVKAEVGERFDGGDAELGSGLESGFRLGYLDGKYGVDVALQGRVLLVHTSDYRDWGLGLQASWDPGEKGRGIRASVSSSRGRDGGGRTTLWDSPDAVTRPLGMGSLGMSWQSRMGGEVAYAGLEVPGIRGQLTPYSRVRWTGEGRELAWGTAWSLSAGEQLAQPATFELEGMSRESRTGEPDHGLLLRMSIPF